VIASIPVTIRTGGFHCNKSFTTHVPLLTTMHVSPLAVNYWAICYTFEVNCSTAVGCELCRALVFHWFGSLHILFCSALTCCFVIVWFTVISSLRTFCWSRPGAVASRYHVLSRLLVCANTVSNFKLAPLKIVQKKWKTCAGNYYKNALQCAKIMPMFYSASLIENDHDE